MGTIVIKKGMDTAGITAAIKSIQGRSAKLDGDIQMTGLSILAHIQKNKEVSLFQKLHAALGQGHRRNALVKWALTFGSIKVNMDKKSSKDTPFLYDGEHATNLEGAEAKPWHLFKPEASPREAFSLEATIKALQELLAKQIKAGKVDAHDRRVEVLMAVTPELPVSANDGDDEGTDSEGGNQVDTRSEEVVVEPVADAA